MIRKKLKVFSVGSDWFFKEMDKQKIELYKVSWSPPVELPDDIAKILKALK